jgi:hypothetical protein
MPRPDVKVKPAIQESSPVRLRVAELQNELLSKPGDATLALELSGIFMDLAHPEWALPVLDPPLAAHPDDYRLHQAQALAFVDHFEAGYAYTAAQKALALCEVGSSTPCDESDQARLTILRDTLLRIKNMDMRRDPNSAKDQIIKGLRLTYIPKKKSMPPVPAATEGKIK